MTFLFRIRDIQGRLNVVFLSSESRNEINLATVLVTLPVRSGRSGFDYTDIYGISSRGQYIVNDILHNMSFLLLPQVQADIPEADIFAIEFGRRFKIFLSLDVIALHLAEQKRISQIGEIFRDFRIRNFAFFDTAERIRYFRHIGQRTNSGT